MSSHNPYARKLQNSETKKEKPVLNINFNFNTLAVTNLWELSSIPYETFSDENLLIITNLI